MLGCSVAWTRLLEAVYQNEVPILSPVTDNLLFLNQRKRERVFYGLNISQLIRFARVCSRVEGFNNKSLTAKLLRQGYRYHKLRKA